MDAISVAAEPQSSLWAALVEAVRGSHRDYTAGSLNRAILLLAVPMVLEMVLESLFAVVDVFLGGKTWGQRCRHGRTHGVDAESGIRGGHGPGPVHYGDGRAAYRGKGSGGRGGGGSAGDCSRDHGFGRHWVTVRFAGAAASAVDGSVGGDCVGGQRVHQDLPGRQWRGAAAVFE